MPFQRVVRAWKERGTTGLIRHIVKRTIPVHKSLVYTKKEKSAFCTVPGLAIERFRLRSDIKPEIIDMLRTSRGNREIREVDKLFARGCELWLGSIKEEIAGFCWSQGNKVRDDYFIHLDKEDATILSCFVLPKYRGRSIYPTMLETIVTTLMNDDKVSNVYIDCKSWNIPSICGIQKAGFSFLGSAVRMILCGHVWILWNRCEKASLIVLPFI